MDKLRNFWDNIVVWGCDVYNRPVRWVSLIFLVVSLLTIMYHRVPRIYNCTWEAVVVQSVPSEKWRFNWYPNDYLDQCQYFNGTRWMPLDKSKVLDVGSMEDLGELQ